jgi:hypothetical protein
MTHLSMKDYFVSNSYDDTTEKMIYITSLTLPIQVENGKSCKFEEIPKKKKNLQACVQSKRVRYIKVKEIITKESFLQARLH